MLVISSEMQEWLGICDRISVINEGKVVGVERDWDRRDDVTVGYDVTVLAVHYLKGGGMVSALLEPCFLLKIV